MDCLFCGGVAAAPYNFDHGKRSTSWSKACLTSLSIACRLHPDDPVRVDLVDPFATCATCRQLVMDLDFWIRLLDKAISGLESAQGQLLAQLEQVNSGQKSQNPDAGVGQLAKKFRAESAIVNKALEEFKGVLNLSRLKVMDDSKGEEEVNVHQVKEEDMEFDPFAEEEVDSFHWDDQDRNEIEPTRIPCPLCHLTFAPGRGLAIHSRKIHKKPSLKEGGLEKGGSKTLPHSPLGGNAYFTRKKSQKTLDKDSDGGDLNNPLDSEQDEEDSEASEDSDYSEEKDKEQEPSSEDQENSDSDVYEPPSKKDPPSKSKKRKPRPPKKKVMIPCPHCEQTFASAHKLVIHTQKCHPDSNPLTCPSCGLTFATTTELEAHEEEHRMAETPFSCTICRMITQNSVMLKRHMTQFHVPNGGVVQYLCDICGISLQSSKSLSAHRRKHDGTGFNCEICSKSFRTNSDLQYHSRNKHSATSKSWICEICGKGFVYPKGLKEHQATHKENNGNKCRICGKSFTHRQNLLRHEVIHSGLKPYSCDYCEDRRFSCITGKYQHQNLHCSRNPDKKIGGGGIKRKRNKIKTTV